MLEPISLDSRSASVSGASDRALAEVVDRIAARLRRGELIHLESEIAEHPACADGLRMLWPTLAALVVVRSGDPSTTDVENNAACNDRVREQAIETPVSLPGSLSPSLRLSLAPSPTHRLVDFELIREVGRGGMGIVYEARQVSLGRRVAVKVLPSAGLLDARQLQRFQNEARAAAQLNHPHIVDCFCVGCDDGVHYFAMRFVDGQTLAEIVNSVVRGPLSVATNYGPLTTGKKAEWIAQAAEALEHAHASGVVHRDIKPSNLLVDVDGKLWVTDFGVARFGDDAGLTLTGDLLGTLRYMSPEQALGRLADIGPRSDVYSLGATLYELLASRPVFDGEDRGELLRQVAFGRPVALRTVDPRLPRDLETIAQKALEKSPDDRYATAGEMAADLRRYLRGEPIRAKPPTLAQLTTKWCLRHRGLVATATAVLLLAVAGLLTSTLLIARSRDDAVAAQKVAEDRDRDNRRMLSVIETGLAMQYYQRGEVERAKNLLDRQTESEIQDPDGEVGGFPRQWLRQAASTDCAVLNSLASGSGEVFDIAFGPDGTFLAAACQKKILVYDVHQGAVHLQIDAHRSDVNALDFSPDGGLIASGGDDRAVRLWNVVGGNLAGELTAHDSAVVCLAFSRDGRLATGDQQGTVIVWNVDHRREERRLAAHTGRVDSLAFTADGRLLSVSEDWNMVAWDIDGGQRVWQVRAPHSSFLALAVSPDGRTLAAGDHLGIISTWDASDGRPLGRLGMRRRVMEDLAFSPDGTLLAAGTHDGTTQLWDVSTRTFLGQTGAHRDRVWCVAFSPDNRMLATGSRDGSVKFWTLGGARQSRRVATADPDMHIGFSAGAQTLAIGSGNDVWRWRRGASQPEKRRSDAWACSPVLCWRGEDLVLQDGQGDLWLEDGTGKTTRWIDRRGPVAHQVSVSPDRRWLAVRDGEGAIELWDAAAAKMKGQIGEFNGTPFFLADSRSIVAGRDARLLRWDVPPAAPREIYHLPGLVHYVACSQSGELLAIAYDDARLELVRLSNGQTSPLVGHELGVTCAAFSPDGGTLASGSYDGTLRLWNVATGQEYYTLERRPDGDIRSIVFSSDGRSLAAAGRDGAGGSVGLWELK